MSRFTGPAGRGAAAAARQARRAEAEARNARTLPHKRRGYWRDFDTATDAGDEPGPCQWPWKTAYENRAAVAAALGSMQRHRRQQGLKPYQCAAGHFHLGRHMRRAVVAWKAVA